MGKGIMFMVFVWMIVCIAGGVLQGSMVFATTTLTSAISDTDTTIPVASTEGFTKTGFVTIGDERIGHASKTDTTFVGGVVNPLLRGAGGTTAVAHSAGERVRTVESSMLNQSVGYKMAIITDASGILAFVTIPLALLSLLGSFFTLPLNFFGTDLEILAYLWTVLTIGILIAVGVALVGGRRV